MSYFKTLAAMGLAAGSLMGSADDAQAWWVRSQTLDVPDTSSMPKTSLETVNIHGYITASGNRAYAKLCRKVWYEAGSAATVCSSNNYTPYSSSSTESFTLDMANRLGTWTSAGGDFAYISFGATYNQAQINGVFYTN